MTLKSRNHTPLPPDRYASSLGRKAPAVVHTLSVSLLLAAVLAVFVVDVPVAEHFKVHPLPGSVVELHNVAELFGHGLGVMTVIVVLATLDPLHRWIIPRLAFAAWGGGMAADLIKVCVTRPRPFWFDTTGLTTSWSSFGGVVESFSDGSAIQSFPSAHVATAAGLAVVLSRLYPHGRWLFVAMVVIVASQRVGGQSHWVSDCCAGGLVGWAAAQVTFQEPWASRWLDRLEYWLGRPCPDAPLHSNADDAADDQYDRAA
jgi:membrane-associated phospholipid phosphatase